MLFPKVKNFLYALDECKLKRNFGSAVGFKNLSKKWNYDYNIKKCFEFMYYGTAGNANNFDTCSQCVNRCVKVTWKLYFRVKNDFNSILKTLSSISINSNRYVSSNIYNKQGNYFKNLLRKALKNTTGGQSQNSKLITAKPAFDEKNACVTLK